MFVQRQSSWVGLLGGGSVSESLSLLSGGSVLIGAGLQIGRRIWAGRRVVLFANILSRRSRVPTRYHWWDRWRWTCWRGFVSGERVCIVYKVKWSEVCQFRRDPVTVRCLDSVRCAKELGANKRCNVAKSSCYFYKHSEQRSWALSYCDQSRGRLSSLLRSVRLGGSLQWVPLTMIRFRCESALLTTVIFVFFESHQGPSPLIRTLLKPHISVFFIRIGPQIALESGFKKCGFGSYMRIRVEVAQVYTISQV